MFVYIQVVRNVDKEDNGRVKAKDRSFSISQSEKMDVRESIEQKNKMRKEGRNQ